MTGADDAVRRDIALVRYREALAAEDLATLADVWQQAELDPALERSLAWLNAELLQDRAGQPDQPAAAPGETQERLERINADLVRGPGDRPDQAVAAAYSGYRCSVLVVDDQPFILSLMRRVLAPEFEVLEASSVAAAQDVFARRPVDILLADLCLAGPPAEDLSGIELVEWVRAHSPRTVCLLMSGFGTMESVIEAINRGHVLHYLRKPFENLDRLAETFRQASRVFTLERMNHELLERLKDLNMELEEKVRQRTRELIEAIHELDVKNKTLEKLALTDSLTGLPNRRAMDHLAERELLWRKRYPGPLALGLVDIDHFKAVNTAHLWSGGDRVLTEVARCLSGHLREIDHLGRYGGEEFMLIAPQTDRRGAEVLAERLRSRVEATPILYKGHTIRVTVSVGVAVVEADAPADLAAMWDACEAALAAAKEQGRNRSVVTVLPPDQGRTAYRARG
jgi:diguanylate cyclase (GGDEF)-like protein